MSSVAIPPGTVVVEAEHLERRFGDHVAVRDLSLAIGAGEVFAFLGPNGSGKTTTIRMLCGIVTPTAGRGRVLGYDIVRESERVRASIGYMSQRFALYEDLTVQENLEFYGGVYGVTGRRLRERVADLIEMAGLKGHERQLAGQLSGGWKQRLALGCAIVHQPPILFLDEPTAGVDPVSRRNFWTLIYGLAESGVTVFLTTHYLDEAEHANRVGLLLNGELIGVRTPEQWRREGLDGALYELECDAAPRALALLRGRAGLGEVALYGTRLHVLVERDGPRPELLVSWLTTQGIGVRRITAIEPTLEDVFIALIRPRGEQT